MRMTKIDQAILLTFFAGCCVSFWCGLQWSATQSTVRLRGACDAPFEQRVKLKQGYYAEVTP